MAAVRTLPPRPAPSTPVLIEAPWAEHILDLRVDSREDRPIPDLPETVIDASMGDALAEVATQFADGTGWSLTLIPGAVAQTITSTSRSTGQPRTTRKLDWVAAIEAPDGTRSGLAWSFLSHPQRTLSQLLGIPLATPLGRMSQGWDDDRSWEALRHLHHALLDPWSWAGIPQGGDLAADDLDRLYQWAPHGLDAAAARHWRDLGISTGRDLGEWRKACPNDAFIATWCHAMTEPEEALLWASTGATPDIATYWRRHASDPTLAASLHGCGWRAEDLDPRGFDDLLDDLRERLRRLGRPAYRRGDAAATIVRAAHRAGLTPNDALRLLGTVDDPDRVATLADLAVGANLRRRDAFALLASPLTLIEARKALANRTMDFDALRLMGALTA